MDHPTYKDHLMYPTFRYYLDADDNKVKSNKFIIYLIIHVDIFLFLFLIIFLYNQVKMFLYGGHA